MLAFISVVAAAPNSSACTKDMSEMARRGFLLPLMTIPSGEPPLANLLSSASFCTARGTTVSSKEDRFPLPPNLKLRRSPGVSPPPTIVVLERLPAPLRPNVERRLDMVGMILTSPALPPFPAHVRFVFVNSNPSYVTVMIVG